MVTLSVLGPLVLRDAADAIVRLGSVRQRRLLTALALYANAPVADDVLAELTWGAAQPVDAVGAVHTNIGRLRRVLPPAARILTEPRSYRLAIDPLELDVLTFAARVRTAEERTGDDRVHLLDAALALWRGQPFDELDHPAVAAAVRRLIDLRLTAEESRADALVGGGRPAEAVDGLEAVIAEEPTREGAVALLMRALCATGRQSDALRAYTRLRKALAEDLGIEPSEPLRRLEEQVLRQELATSARRPFESRARPLPHSSFVGRDRDLQRVVELLAGRQVVTIAGPGGVGKTRLARHAVHAAREHYADGVIWIELGAVVDAGHIPAAIANELRLTVTAGEALLDQVADVLAGRRVLVVLDNCEHLAEDIAVVVERIAGPVTVDVLATSRVPLRIDDEHIVVLAPLDEQAAVQLFLDRLDAVAPDTVAASDAAVVGEIVGRLDGLPLVLELAAARVPGLGLRGLRDALDEPFGVLSGGRRAGTGRHRSLLDVVEWSVRLLTDAQRDLFVDMAAFAGPVELAAVAAVAGGRADAPVAATVADLVERSLLNFHDGDPPTYGMFEFLRAYGRGHLREAGRERESSDRHARWALGLADDLFAAELSVDQARARRRLDAHVADLRRAHAWLRQNGRTGELIRLTTVLAHHAYHRLLVDLVGLVDETLAAVAHIDDPGRVRLLGIAANFGWQRGDLPLAERRSTEALTLAGALGSDDATAPAHEALGTVLLMRGDLAGASREYDLARRLAAASGDHYTATLALTDLGLSATYAGDDATAAGYGDALDALAAALGAPSIRGWAAYLHGERCAERDPAAATRHLSEAVALAEEVDDRFLAGVARHTLMTTAARVDEAGHAVTSFAGLLEQWSAAGAWTQLWLTMRSLIEALSRDGHHRDAAVLLGAHATSRRAPPLFGADASRLDVVIVAARLALGDAFEAAWADGAALDDDGAIALATSLTRPGGADDVGRGSGFDRPSAVGPP